MDKIHWSCKRTEDGGFLVVAQKVLPLGRVYKASFTIAKRDFSSLIIRDQRFYLLTVIEALTNYMEVAAVEDGPIRHVTISTKAVE